MAHRIPLLTFLITVPVLLAAQQFSAEKPIQYPDAASVEDVTAGDLDNDGDLDVVIGTSGSSARVGAYFNDGTGAFGPFVKLADAHRAYEVALVDLDNDGDLDITWANWGSPNTAWCRNLGAGIFASRAALSDITASNACTSIDWGDVDEDGHLDLFTLNYANGTVGWCHNDGQQGFPVRQSILGVDNAWHCAADDMDGDGDVDVVLVGAEVRWRGNINNDFVDELPPNSGILDEFANNPTNVLLYDPTGTGNPNVYTANTADDQVGGFGNLGGGVYNAGGVIGAAPGVKDLALADVNNDGQMDLLAACPEDNTIRVFYTMGSANILFTDVAGASAMVGGDFNNDGLTDVVSVGAASGDVALHKQIAPGTWAPRQRLNAISGGVSEMLAADLDSDGLGDAVFLLSGTHALCWRRNLGDDTFGTAQVIDDALTVWGQVLAHDLDGDDDLDLVMGFANQKLAWYRNNGSGGFTIPLTIASDFGPTDEFDIGDLDGDGDADIAAASSSHNLQCFLNTGTGNFDPPVQVDAAGGYELVLGDVDADGDRDIVMHRNTGGIRIYLNDGNALFAAAPVVPSAAQCQDMRLGDMNGDGATDIVSIRYPGGSINAYLSNGDGTFATEDTLASSGGATFQELALADMDGDADLDVVTGVYFDGELLWYPNDGSGQVGPANTIMTGLGIASQCAVADLDGDGDPDPMGGSWSSQRASWFENFIGSPFRAEGRLYYDLDGSADWNAGDVPFPYHAVNCTPSASAPYSGPQGLYGFTTDEGAYTISAPSTDPFWTIATSPSTYTINLTGNDPIADSLDFGYVPAYDTLVLEVASTASPLGCAQPYNRWIDIANRGTLAADAVVDLVLPVAETVLTTDPAPDQVIGNHYRWNLPTLPVLGHTSIHLTGEHGLGTGFNLYDSLRVSATAPGANGIYDEAHTRPTVCSFDPNDKQVAPLGYGESGAIDIGTDRLRYTIRFQNTGTDTAFTVMLRDRLSPWLDRSSIHVIGTSHTLTSLNVENDGEAVFLFDDILLPDSNVNEPASHGHVVFSIGVLPGAPSGTQIDNEAEIHFDVNAPVQTNTVMNTLIDCSLFDASIAFIDNLYLQATEGDAYQWYLNGEAITGAVQRELFFVENGSYSVVVTSAFGCSAVTPPYEVVSTGMPSAHGPDMAIIPDPVVDLARVVFSERPAPSATLEVRDATGRWLSSLPCGGAAEVRFARGSWAPGTYLLFLRSGTELLGVRRFTVR